MGGLLAVGCGTVECRAGHTGTSCSPDRKLKAHDDNGPERVQAHAVLCLLGSCDDCDDVPMAARMRLSQKSPSSR